MHDRPGQSLLRPDHPGAKARWNATEPLIVEGEAGDGVKRAKLRNGHGVDGVKKIKLSNGTGAKVGSVVEVTTGNRLTSGHT